LRRGDRRLCGRRCGRLRKFGGRGRPLTCSGFELRDLFLQHLQLLAQLLDLRAQIRLRILCARRYGGERKRKHEQPRTGHFHCMKHD
jgi:hypothetical protein